MQRERQRDIYECLFQYASMGNFGKDYHRIVTHLSKYLFYYVKSTSTLINMVIVTAFSIIDRNVGFFVGSGQKQRTSENRNERVDNKEKTSKCQQFALRADFSLNVAAARSPMENAQRKVEAIVPTYLLIVCSVRRIKFKRCVQALPASQPAHLPLPVSHPP